MDDTVSPYFSGNGNMKQTIDGASSRQEKGENINVFKRKVSDDFKDSNTKKFGGVADNQNNPSCSSDVPLTGYKLDKSFFDKDCIALSKALLGKISITIFS